MVDVHSSRPALEAFCELADDIISTLSCSTVDDLKRTGDIQYHIDNNNTSIFILLLEMSVALMCAHLAYNFHVRLELFCLTTPFEIIEVTEGDILASIDCIDYLADQLKLVESSSSALNMWGATKSAVREYLSSQGNRSGFRELRDLFQETSSQFVYEMTHRWERSFIFFMLHLHNVCVLAANVQIGGRMAPENVTNFMDNFSGLSSNFMSVRYRATCEDVLHSMMTLCNETLTSEEAGSIAKKVIWLTRNFIYEVDANHGERLRNQRSEPPPMTIGMDNYNTLDLESPFAERRGPPGEATPVRESDIEQSGVEGPEQRDVEESGQSDVEVPEHVDIDVLEQMLEEASTKADFLAVQDRVERLRREWERQLEKLFDELTQMYSSLRDTTIPFIVESMRTAIAEKRAKEREIDDQIAKLDYIGWQVEDHLKQLEQQPRLDYLEVSEVDFILKRTLQRKAKDSASLAELLQKMGDSVSDSTLMRICEETGIVYDVNARRKIIEKLREI